MNNMYDAIGIPFGYLISFMYKICGSYVFALILFTLIVRFLFLPAVYKTKLHAKRMRLIQPELDSVRVKYKGNLAKIREEQTKICDREGIHQMDSFPLSIAQVILSLGVIDAIYKPLTHIVHISKNIRISAVDIASSILDQKLSIDSLSSELTVLRQYRLHPDSFSGLSGGFSKSVSGFLDTFTLFGINLSEVPMHMHDFSTAASVLAWSFPLIYTLMTLVSGIVQQRRSKAKFSIFTVLIPMFMFFVGVQLPVGISFYWILGFVISNVMGLCVDQYLSNDRLQHIHEKKKAAYIAKPHAAGNFTNTLMQEFDSGLAELMGRNSSAKDHAKNPESIENIEGPDVKNPEKDGE